MLCENQFIDYFEGTQCGLTKEAPRFGTVCNEIRFDKKLKEKVTTINAKYQRLKKDNFVIYAYSFLFSLIGMSVVLGAFYFSNYIWERGYISSLSIVIAAIGILVIGVAISTFTKHRNKYKIAKKRKKELDDVLQLYQIDYDLTIKFGRHSREAMDFQSDVTINKKGIR